MTILYDDPGTLVGVDYGLTTTQRNTFIGVTKYNIGSVGFEFGYATWTPGSTDPTYLSAGAVSSVYVITSYLNEDRVSVSRVTPSSFNGQLLSWFGGLGCGILSLTGAK